MIEDLHKSSLASFYKELIKKAKNLLIKKYSAVQIDKNDNDFPSNINSKKFIFFKVHIEANKYPLVLIIAIPNHFPDEFPKIYISEKNYSEIGQIPHVDKNRFVCTKDPNIAVLNDNRPDLALDKLIEVALDIINKGIKKESKDDFTDEFLAYWNEESKYKLFSLFIPKSKIETVKIIFPEDFKIANTKANGLIVRIKEDYDEWMNNLGLPSSNIEIVDALYLPLSEPISFPLPKKNNKVFKIIKDSGKNNFKALKKYLNMGDSPNFILFSFPIKNERILAGWKSPLWGETMNGFRPGKVPIEQRMRKSGTSLIKKISIERVDQDRLFRRGGVGIKTSFKKTSIAIIGCGSLGSPLAISLLKSGISKFFLIDNDILEPANVARHICGMSDAVEAPYKSELLCKKMLQHFPHIECKSSKEDILDVLEHNETCLNNYDISIIALGNKSVERRLNYLARKEVLKSHLIFIWMEPFGVAGHMFYLHPDNGGCFQCCFDSEGIFKYSVAKHHKDFFKRESGCQSTYVPYSNLEIDSFINSVTREILYNIDEKPKQSYLMTWIGNTTFFESMGYTINNKWTAYLNYSIHKNEIQQNNNCEICITK